MFLYTIQLDEECQVHNQVYIQKPAINEHSIIHSLCVCLIYVKFIQNQDKC